MGEESTSGPELSSNICIKENKKDHGKFIAYGMLMAIGAPTNSLPFIITHVENGKKQPPTKHVVQVHILARWLSEHRTKDEVNHKGILGPEVCSMVEHHATIPKSGAQLKVF